MRRFCDFVVLFTRLHMQAALQTVARGNFSIQQKVIPLCLLYFSLWKTLPVKQRFLTLSTGFSTESRGKHAIQSVKLCGNVESLHFVKNYNAYSYSSFHKKGTVNLSRNMHSLGRCVLWRLEAVSVYLAGLCNHHKRLRVNTLGRTLHLVYLRFRAHTHQKLPLLAGICAVCGQQRGTAPHYQIDGLCRCLSV